MKLPGGEPGAVKRRVGRGIDNQPAAMKRWVGRGIDNQPAACRYEAVGRSADNSLLAAAMKRRVSVGGTERNVAVTSSTFWLK